MAERRMMSKKITDTDAFLYMPLTTQALYFHFLQNEDDDGFVGSPNSIMRKVGASKNDYDLLMVKRFIIVFDSGICVIKHWRIHNYIQKDRYVETTFLKEKAQLKTEENGAYTECIQNVYKLDAQYSIGKDSIGEVSIGKDREDTQRACAREESDEEETLPEFENPLYKQIAKLYNGTCTSLPKVTTISSARERVIKTRLKEFTVKQFQTLFRKAQASKFLTGKNKNNWRANFDWLMNATNFAKVLDGNYDDYVAPHDGMSGKPEDDLPF